MDKKWDWRTKYSAHDFILPSGERKIYVPKFTRKSSGSVDVKVSEENQAKQARQYFDLLIAAEGCYSKYINVGGLLRNAPPKYDGMSMDVSRIALYMPRRAESKMFLALREAHLELPVEKYAMFNSFERIEKLFTIQHVNNTVRDFSDRTSPLLTSAKSIKPEWEKTFHEAISNTAAWSRNYFTVSETTQLINETRERLKVTLASVGTEVNEENIATLATLASLRRSESMILCFRNMPYLRKYARVDKNLALLVGKGMEFEHMLLFSAFDNYPATQENLDVFLELPYSWIVKAFT